MSRILCVGGAPRLPIDAIRHLTVAATGQTARRLHRLFIDARADCDLLLSIDARQPEDEGVAQIYGSRGALERALESWIAANPTGTIVMSAAVNDYEVASLSGLGSDGWHDYLPGGKVPSGLRELRIGLRPAAKLIDRFPDWGHRGPLVAFKYEDAGTVEASAETLRRRVGASAVLANSLDGLVQALVTEAGTRSFPDRESVCRALVDHVLRLPHPDH